MSHVTESCCGACGLIFSKQLSVRVAVGCSVCVVVCCGCSWLLSRVPYERVACPVKEDMSHVKEHVTCERACHMWKRHVTCERDMSHVKETCHMWKRHVTFEGGMWYVWGHMRTLNRRPLYIHIYKYIYIYVCMCKYVYTHLSRVCMCVCACVHSYMLI